jgi:hypothetical protein
VSGYVALCLSLPGAVVTWFVTGFPDPGKADGSHAVPLKPALSGQDKLTVAGDLAMAGNMAGATHAPISCDNSGLGWRTFKEAACPRRRLVAALPLPPARLLRGSRIGRQTRREYSGSRRGGNGS